MTDIDLNTGLPALPENFFWRVGEHVSGFPFEAPCVRVELVEKYLEPKLVETLNVNTFLWFNRKVEVYEEENVHFRQDIYEKVDGERIIDKSLSEVTPADILETAQKLFDRYTRVKETRNLFGNYPPKKLPEITENNND